MQRLTLAILLAIALVQGFAYATLVPPWSAPDEPYHFVYTRELWLQAEGKAPNGVEKEVLVSMGRHDWYTANRMEPSEKDEPTLLKDVPFLRTGGVPRGYHPSPYYHLSVAVLRLSGQTGVDEQLYVLRVFNILLGVAVVATAYAVARTLFPGDKLLAVLVSGLVALLPQRAFVSASVNNDNLAILAASLAFLALAWIFRKGPSLPNLAILAVLTATLPFTKRTALAMLSAPALAAAAFAVVYIGERRSWRTGVFALLAIVAGAVALGWLLLFDESNALLALLKPVPGFNQLRLDNGLKGLKYLLDGQHYGSEHIAVYARYIEVMIESFWARFGWMSVTLPGEWYRIPLALTLLSFVGVARFLFWERNDGTDRLEPASAFGVLLSVVVLLVGFVFTLAVQLPPHGLPQGRYALPEVIPYAIVFYVGLRALVPRGLHRGFTVVLLASLVAFNLYCLLGVILPYYYRF